MAKLKQRHKELDENGVGSCSAPAWRGGAPAGFCENDAYGERPETKHYRDSRGVLRRKDGRYEGHVPALACPAHGGPKEKKEEYQDEEEPEPCQAD